MKDLEKDFPPGVDYKIIYDPTVFIAKSVQEVVITIFIAILLVLGVVFLFLQNWRASIIPGHRDSGFARRNVRDSLCARAYR